MSNENSAGYSLANPFGTEEDLEFVVPGQIGYQPGLYEQTLAAGYALPQRPRPQTQDELLGLFSGSAVGRDVVLQPATLTDTKTAKRVNRAPCMAALKGPKGAAARTMACARWSSTLFDEGVMISVSTTRPRASTVMFMVSSPYSFLPRCSGKSRVPRSSILRRRWS